MRNEQELLWVVGGSYDDCHIAGPTHMSQVSPDGREWVTTDYRSGRTLRYLRCDETGEYLFVGETL